ncbi:MAG: UDP-glucose 4-epimerase GalE [Chlamydiales bacterium]
MLVVGGAGYIGSHVCRALLEAGFDPIVYDNLSTGHSWSLLYGPFIQGDVGDEESLLRAFDMVRPSAVIHLASLINVRDSIGNPSLYYEKNLLGALVLLKSMVKASVHHLVFSSTAAVYGTPQYTPIDEKHPKAPLNAYGKTKWAIEGMLEDFAHAHGLRFAALRYFNAAGASLDSQIGEAHEPETHLIPLVIQTALGLRPILQIYGNDYSTPDGTAIRDYVHVLDLADAHVKALRYLFEQGPPLQANLGTGSGYSVQEIIHAVEQFSGATVPTQILPRLPHDSPVLVADPSLAKQIFQWEPKYSDLATIISSAWNWTKLGQSGR